MTSNFKTLALVLLILLSVFTLVFPQDDTTVLPEEFDVERIRAATVFVMQARMIDNELFITCVGSGTIVTRTGLVLTNAHNVVQGTECAGDTLLIALSVQPGQPPVPKYRASIVQTSPGIDLALLQIDEQLDGRAIDVDTLALPFVELADSDQTRLDDTLIVVGYPDFTDQQVRVIRTTISGFTAEPGSSARAWIKTSAAVSGMMSGGGAYNRRGQMVGVPTTAPITLVGDDVNCLPLQDSTGDGLVNQEDICVPVGGFINALRPSNFARSLLRAATLGLNVEKLNESVQDAAAPAGRPSFSRLFVAPSVTVEGMPSTVINTLPTGADSFYLFFDYENMTPETVYSLQVTIDGIPSPTFSLAPVRWSGGQRGLWYIGAQEQALPNGTYEFTLAINGVTQGSRSIIVGPSTQQEPSFSALAFGALRDGSIVGNGYVIGTGNAVAAVFTYQNMTEQVNWTGVWYYNGSEIQRSPNNQAWDITLHGASGDMPISITSETGLPPGIYRLELYIGDNTIPNASPKLAALADFTIAGALAGDLPQIFSDIRFVTATGPDEAMGAPTLSSFPTGVERLYALFNWTQIAPGTLWTMRWLVDGEPFFESTLPWSGVSGGANFLTELSGARGVPDGSYTIELRIGNVVIARTQAQVGIGQLPIDRFADPTGIQLRGEIVDADTGEGIPGVTFVLISEDFSVEDFVWDQEQVFATAVTDRSGTFIFDRPLQRAAPYSVIINAAGYLPISRDGFELDDETPNPLDLTISLIRDAAVP